jgi:transketolase-like protein
VPNAGRSDDQMLTTAMTLDGDPAHGRLATMRPFSITFYDDNGISIDGELHGWSTDDTPMRFEAYGWHVVCEIDGHNPAADTSVTPYLLNQIVPERFTRRAVGWRCGSRC